MKRLLSDDGAVKEVFHLDKIDGKIHIETKQDVQPILDANKEKRNSQSENWKGDMHQIGCIPLVVIQQWNKKYKCNVLSSQNRHLIMLELRRPENAYLRTKTGRI